MMIKKTKFPVCNFQQQKHSPNLLLTHSLFIFNRTNNNLRSNHKKKIRKLEASEYETKTIISDILLELQKGKKCVKLVKILFSLLKEINETLR